MIVVDVEACGTNPNKSSLVSIGAVDFKNPDNQFYEECHIFKGAEIEDEALAVPGFSKKEINDKNKKDPKELIASFLRWAKKIKNATLVGNHVSFDRDFMRFPWIYRYKKKWPLGYRTIDLHSIAYGHFLKIGKRIPMEKNLSVLGTTRVLKYVGLPEEPRPHNALTGAKVEAEAFARLVYGKSILKEFADYKIPKELIRS